MDHDPLAGLVNHRAFHARFEDEVERALRKGGPLTLALLDLDNFAFFNDAYGHAVGDDVLRRVAALLGSHGRAADVAARYGENPAICRKRSLRRFSSTP